MTYTLVLAGLGEHWPAEVAMYILTTRSTSIPTWFLQEQPVGCSSTHTLLMLLFQP